MADPKPAESIFAPVEDPAESIFAPTKADKQADIVTAAKLKLAEQAALSGTDDELTIDEFEEQLGSIVPLDEEGNFGVEAATRRVLGPAGTLTREAATAAGAMVGHFVGEAAELVPGAGKLAKIKAIPKGRVGESVGAMLGAGAGSLVFDTIDDAIRYLQAPTGPGIEAVNKFGDALEQSGAEAFSSAGEGLRLAGEAYLGEDSDAPRRYDSPYGPTKEAAEQMELEGLVQSAIPAVKLLPAGIKNAFRKLFGTTDPHTVELANLAAAYKIPLGLVQGTSHEWLKGFTRVLGVLPFVGGPFKKSAAATDEALGVRLFEMMDSFSPSVFTTAQMSRKLVDRAAEKFGFFNTASNRLYNKFFDMTKHLPADRQTFIPTKTIREAAEGIIEAAKSGTETIKKAVPEQAKTIQSLAADLMNMNKRIDPATFKADIENIAEIMRGLDPASKAHKEGVVLKAAYESALSSPALNFSGRFKNGVLSDAADAISGRDIAKQLKKANSFFDKGMLKFESATANKFGKVDRNLFDSAWKKAGTKEKDELFKDVFNLKSRDSLRQLQKLVGAKAVHRSLRSLIDETIEGSSSVIRKRLLKIPNLVGGHLRDDITGALPDAQALAKLEKVLGIGTTKGEEVLTEALRYTGVGVKDLKNFFTLANASQSFYIPDASVFLQRRVTLGGLAALGAAGGTIAAAGAALFPTAAKLTLMRMGSKYLTNPKNLRTLTQALSDEFPDRIRRAAYARLVQDLNKISQDDPELTDAEIEILKQRAYQAAKDTIQVTPSQLMQAGQQLTQSGQQAIGAIQKSLSPTARQKIQSATEP